MVSLVLLAATIFFFAKFSFHAGSSERPCYKVGMHERHFERLGINHVSPQPEQFWMALFHALDGDLDNVSTKNLTI